MTKPGYANGLPYDWTAWLRDGTAVQRGDVVDGKEVLSVAKLPEGSVRKLQLVPKPDAPRWPLAEVDLAEGEVLEPPTMTRDQKFGTGREEPNLTVAVRVGVRGSPLLWLLPDGTTRLWRGSYEEMLRTILWQMEAAQRAGLVVVKRGN